MTGTRASAYAVLCRDRTDIDALAVRAEHLADHLVYIEQILPHILVAGPVRAPGSMRSSDPVTGSMLVFRAETETEARTLLEGDPYFKAGLWDVTVIYPFLAVAGAWVGGKTW